MTILYILHISCVVLSLSGFAGRGLLFFFQPRWLAKRWINISPHIIDTLLLASAIGLVIQREYNVLQQDWILAKILALLVYISAGLYLFRFAKDRAYQIIAFGIALTSAGYIVMVAINKSVWPFSNGI